MQWKFVVHTKWTDFQKVEKPSLLLSRLKSRKNLMCMKKVYGLLMWFNESHWIDSNYDGQTEWKPVQIDIEIFIYIQKKKPAQERESVCNEGKYKKKI